MSVTEVILDVDTGVDDALAIMFAVRQPALHVRAITCVAGNAHVDQVVRNTHAVLTAAGAEDIPVARGAERPLLNAVQDARFVHGADGLAGLGAAVPRAGHTASGAVGLLREAILASPTPATLIPLGPMTNIALLLRTHPEVLANLERIVFMGGSAATGNATAVAEFNVWHDPEAAAIVLGCDVPVTMYGLDVFYQPVVTTQVYLAWQQHPDPGVRMTGHLLAHLRGVAGADPRNGCGAALGDAGAVCAVVEPALLHTERLPVQVELAPGLSRGQTLVDRRRLLGEDLVHGHQRPVRPVDVALGVDGPGLADLFTRTVLAVPTRSP